MPNACSYFHILNIKSDRNKCLTFSLPLPWCCCIQDFSPWVRSEQSNSFLTQKKCMLSQENRIAVKLWQYFTNYSPKNVRVWAGTVRRLYSTYWMWLVINNSSTEINIILLPYTRNKNIIIFFYIHHKFFFSHGRKMRFSFHIKYKEHAVFMRKEARVKSG